MASTRPFSKKEKAAVAVALSWGAGMVDVAAYLSLYHVFVTHMTGNTVSAVLNGVQHDWVRTFQRGLPIAAFFAGLMLAEIMLESAKRRRRSRIAAWALGMEAACLGGFLLLGLIRFGATPRIAEPSAPWFVALVLLASAAMGVQSAALRKIGALTIFTTFMTGTLTKLANDLTVYLFWLRDQTRGGSRRSLREALRLSPRQESFQAVVLLTAIYLAYVTGALAGAVGFERWGIAIVAAPLLLVVMAIVVDILRPISPMP